MSQQITATSIVYIIMTQFLNQ